MNSPIIFVPWSLLLDYELRLGLRITAVQIFFYLTDDPKHMHDKSAFVVINEAV